MEVSVITTLFNYRRYIGAAIESFLAQDLSDSEMIIVDDASKDDPYSVIKPFVGNRVRYIRLDKNSGYSAAKNTGIREAKADVLVMLDADDMLTPRSLTMRYNKLSEGFDLVHGPALDLSNERTTPSSLFAKWLKNPTNYKYIHAQTVMLRRDLHKKVGLYDETLRFKSDREMWARIMSHGFKVGYVKDYVSIYRLHDDQMHKSKAKKVINDVLQKEVEQKILRRASDLSDVIMLK